jgi:hypothetical protein
MDYEVTPGVAHPRYGESWHRAEGPALPATVWFRLARGLNGQWVCTEVEIQSPRPITSSLLRSIPMSQIIDRLLGAQLEYQDRGGPLDPETGLREWYDGGSIAGLTAAQIAAGGETADLTRAEVQSRCLANGDQVPTRAKHGGRGPTDAELDAFATAYGRALQTDRRRSIARTIEILAREHQLFISRATANRWRERLEGRG